MTRQKQTAVRVDRDTLADLKAIQTRLDYRAMQRGEPRRHSLAEAVALAATMALAMGTADDDRPAADAAGPKGTRRDRQREREQIDMLRGP